MGGIFGKKRGPCLFPRAGDRAKGRKAAREFCDAATWTGESQFHSARIGRAPRAPQPPAAMLVLEASGSDFGGEEGDSAVSLRTLHSEVSALVVAGEAQGAELPQEPGAQPHPELLRHQELPGEAPASQNPQDSSEDEAVLHPPGSCWPPELCCGDQGVTLLTQLTVEVDVHVSAGGQEEPGQGQAAAKSELLSGAEQGAGAGSGAEQGAEEALWKVPMLKAGDTTAASCPLEEAELPPEAAEPGEGVTNGQRDVQGQGGEEREAPADLELGQAEVPAPGGVTGAAGEPERAEEVPEACGDGQAAEESPACLPETQQEEEEIQVSSEGEAEEH